MEEKIPYEILLPVALELYQKIPHSDDFFLKPDAQKGETRKLQQEAEDFASFYRMLHDKLAAE